LAGICQYGECGVLPEFRVCKKISDRQACGIERFAAAVIRSE